MRGTKPASLRKTIHEASGMSIDITLPKSSIDPNTGHLLPMTVEERKTRYEALEQALDGMEELTDESDTDEV